MALRHSRRLPLAGVLIAQFALSACSGGSTTLAPVAPIPGGSPTAQASATPTAVATATPTGSAPATPTATASAAPTATATAAPTATPTAAPTATPAPKPTATATASPTPVPTATSTTIEIPPSAPPYIPPSPSFTPPSAPASPAARRSHAVGAACVAPFFNDQVLSKDDVYYLAFPNQEVFGYYSPLNDPDYIDHFTLGYEYLFNANDGLDGVYFYDFTSRHYWYTSPAYFPFFYDFTLHSAIFADFNLAGTAPARRMFYDYGSHSIVTMARRGWGADPARGKPIVANAAAPTITSFTPMFGKVGATVTINGTNFVPPLSIVFAGNAAASGKFTSTQITVTVPSGAETGPITVKTGSGTVSTSSDFTVGTCSAS